jgi:flagellar hook assembly protein FlgD
LKLKEPGAQTQLLGNAPNPFNPQTRIRFHLAQAGQARITVYNVTGRKIRSLSSEHWSAGEHSVVWRGDDENGRQVASGAYYVRLESGGQSDHRKVMMLK